MTRTAVAVPVLFDRIRENIKKSFESRQVALKDIVTVHKRRLWKELDYPSFEECLEVELKIDRFPMPRAERQDAVAFLDNAGLSVRAIAAALGTSQGTTERDREVYQNGTRTASGGQTAPSNGRKTGLDGKSYPARRPGVSRDDPACLTPKAASVRSLAHEVGQLGLDVSTGLCAVKFEDLTDLSFRELQDLSDHLYRFRTACNRIRGYLDGSYLDG